MAEKGIIDASKGAASFLTVFATEIFPVIKADYEDLLSKAPLRISEHEQEKGAKEKEKKKKKEDRKKEDREEEDREKEDREKEAHEEKTTGSGTGSVSSDPVVRQLAKVVEVVKQKSERRNCHMNLAYTAIHDNTPLQQEIPYTKVANMAVDLFMDSSKAVSAQEDPGKKGELAEEATASAGWTVLELMAQQETIPWRIPDQVERGYEIPIMIGEAFATPAIGSFKRLGMDVVVNAVWLALFWAKKEQNATAESALRALILDWPMDFLLIKGSTPEEVEENKFKWGVNMAAKIERLREFVGLENINMMRIIAQAAEFERPKLPGGKKANADVVHKWLMADVNWGVRGTIIREKMDKNWHMQNWEKIRANARTMAVIEAAMQRWGRNNLLDWPTKLSLIVSKTDASSLSYVIEALYTQMWRKNTADPYGAAELKKVIEEIKWTRTYAISVCKKFPELMKDAAPAGSASPAAVCKAFVQSPLAFFEKTESPERDPTWTQSLPTEALRLFMKHMLELSQGLYRPEIAGALQKVNIHKYNIEHFHETIRVKQKFSTPFQVAYDSLCPKPEGAPEEQPAPAEGAPSAGSAPEAKTEGGTEKKKVARETKDLDLREFRDSCEKHCCQELEARLVAMVAEGDHVEIKNSVTSTRLYQNLTAEVPLMAFYDVKNAKLCTIFEGEGSHHPAAITFNHARLKRSPPTPSFNHPG